MRVFISWSGDKSRAVALVLRDWLPVVIQSVDVWCSDTDIEAGANWSSTIGAELAATDFGIICVTKANQDRPWLNFEAGAISKLVSNAAPVLIDFDSKSDLQPGPISSLQVTMLDRDGVSRLLADINRKIERPLTEQILRAAFDRSYAQLESDLAEIRERNFGTHEAPRSEEDKISEILTLTREIVGKLSPGPGDAPPRQRTVTASIPGRPATDEQEMFTRRMVEAAVFDQLESIGIDVRPVRLTWARDDAVEIRCDEYIEKQSRTVAKTLLERRFPTLQFDVRGSVLSGRAAESLRVGTDSGLTVD